MYPAPQAPYYTVIVHSAPLAGFKEILGYNVASSPYEVNEVLRSKTLGIETATRTFMLVEQKRGFIFYAPIYAFSTRQFVGLASGVFHIEPFFNNVRDELVVMLA